MVDASMSMADTSMGTVDASTGTADASIGTADASIGLVDVSCRGMPPNDTRTDTTTIRHPTRLPSDTLPTQTTTQPPQEGDRTKISYEGHLYLTIAYLSACT